MTNPLRLLTLYRKADALVDVLDDGAKAPEEYRTPAFWRRVLLAASALVSSLPLPQGLAMNSALAKVGMIVGTVVAVAGALQSAPIPAKYQGIAALVGSFAMMLAGLLHPAPGQPAK